MENKLYYVESPDGQVLGPMTMIHILEGIAAGVILESARICEVGDTRWIGISEVAHTHEEEAEIPPIPEPPSRPARAGTPERAPSFPPTPAPRVSPPSEALEPAAVAPEEPVEAAEAMAPPPPPVDDVLELDDSPPQAAYPEAFEAPVAASAETPVVEPPVPEPADAPEPFEIAVDVPAEPPAPPAPEPIAESPFPFAEPEPPSVEPFPSSSEMPPVSPFETPDAPPDELPLSARPFEQATAGAGDFTLGSAYATQEPDTDWRAELEPPPPPKKRWVAPTVAVVGVLVIAAIVWWLFGAGGRSSTPEPTVNHPPRPAPTVEQTALERGWLLLRRGSPAEAIIAFQQAVDESPTDAAAQHGLGRAAFDAGKTKLALRHLEEAARLDPNSAQYVVDLAYGKLSAGEHDLALAAARRALELAPDDPTGHLIVGRALAASGDASSAVGSLSIYVEAVPDDHQARLDLAHALAAAGRTEAAIAEANRFLEAFPEDKNVQRERLQWMQSVGQNAEAAILYATLAAQHPDSGWFLYLAGLANPGEDGVTHLQASVARAPSNGDAWALLGRNLTNLGRNDEAVAAFEKAFALRPATDEEFALLSKAKSAARVPKPDPRRAAARQQAANETRELKSAIEMIRSSLATGSPSPAGEAVQAAQAELRTTTARRNLTLWSGIVALEAGSFEEAVERFGSLPMDASFRESGFGVGAVRNWLARAHLSQGDLRSAITVLDRVATDDPNEFAFARLWEGIALSTLGMDDLAERTWQRIEEDVSGLVARSGQAAAHSARFLLGEISEQEYRGAVAGLADNFENDMHYVIGFSARRSGEGARARIHWLRAKESSVGHEFPWHLANAEIEGGG